MRTHSDAVAVTTLVAVITLANCSREITAPVPELTAANSVVGFPLGWSGSLGQPPSFAVGVETANTHSGEQAAFLSNAVPLPPDSTFTQFSQVLRPNTYFGHRVKLSGYFRPTGVILPSAAAAADDRAPPASGLWMRIDGAGEVLAFDNMQDRPVTGTADWRQVSIVLDVPTDAIGIAFGVLFSGTGQLLVDDLTLDTVSVATPTTDMLRGVPAPSTYLTADVAASYQRDPDVPANLGFELAMRGAASSRYATPASPTRLPIRSRADVNAGSGISNPPD
jgi:hypothetical protein